MDNNVENLLIHYVSQLLEDYPCVKLNMDATSTTVSLGYEKSNDLEHIKKYQLFDVLGQYPIAIEFQELTEFIEKNEISSIVLSANEVLLAKE